VTAASLALVTSGGSVLPVLERARGLLVEARTLDAARRIHDVADAVQAYTRQAQLSFEIQNEAAELKLRAARRLGELLANMPRNAGARGRGVRSHDGTALTLAELGISKNQSSRWQAVAALPEPDFDRHLFETRRERRELTTESVLALARPHQRRARFQSIADPGPVRLPPDCTVVVGDAARLELPDASCHGARCSPSSCSHPRLVVTSPPYCLGIAEDGYIDYDDYRVYLAAAERWAGELYRVLPSGGRLALNVPIDISRGGRFPVGSDWLHILLEAGFRYRSTIVWKEGNISQSTARGSIDSPSAINLICPAEAILVVHKDDWNLNRSEPSDLTHPEWLEWTLACWSFAGESAARVGYPAPFPIELPRRLIKLLSFPGDLVLDPFVGSGTTAEAALALGRRFYGCDLNPIAVKRTRLRVSRTTRVALGSRLEPAS
jgi:site-specific DNA-methyltransferase (adenine-specific)